MIKAELVHYCGCIFIHSIEAEDFFYLAFISMDTPGVFCILVPKFHGQRKLDLKDVAVVCAKPRRQRFVIGLYDDVGSIFSSCGVRRID